MLNQVVLPLNQFKMGVRTMPKVSKIRSRLEKSNHEIDGFLQKAFEKEYGESIHGI